VTRNKGESSISVGRTDIQIGSTVRVVNSGNPQINGKIGVVESYIQKMNSYGVLTKTSYGQLKVLVKARELELLPEAVGPAPLDFIRDMAPAPVLADVQAAPQAPARAGVQAFEPTGLPLVGGQMFEVHVDDAARRSDPFGLVPVPVRTCCHWIEQHALTVEGVFRIPGDLARVEEIVEEFNQDFNYQLREDECVPNVASVITYFTREHRNEMGQPQSFGSFARRSAYKLSKLPEQSIFPETADLLLSFSPATRETLWQIAGTLKKVAEEQVDEKGVAINKMTPHKVALCVFPDIMTLVELMIVHYDVLYPMTHCIATSK